MSRLSGRLRFFLLFHSAIMELPENLASLYKHWPYHVNNSGDNKEKGSFILPKKLVWFVKERMKIWEKKTVGKIPPFTDDEILRTYRFCNIFREFDAQTRYFHTLLQSLESNFPLWLLNMFLCRMIARPETIEKIGLLSFNSEQNELWMKKLLSFPSPKYGTPYIFPISVFKNTETPTRETFLARYLPERIPKISKLIESTFSRKSVYEAVGEILPIFGLRLEFLWTEVCIDIAYQYPKYLDLFGRFPIGPGALPTLKKLAPGHKDYSRYVESLAASSNLDVNLTYHGEKIRLSAENWEGIGCEFRKYCNLKNGTGRRRIFANTSFVTKMPCE